MGETIGTGRGVEFGGWVERRVEGEDVQGQIESQVSRSQCLSKRSNALSRLFQDTTDICVLGEHTMVRTNRRMFCEVFLQVDRALTLYDCEMDHDEDNNNNNNNDNDNGYDIPEWVADRVNKFVLRRSRGNTIVRWMCWSVGLWNLLRVLCLLCFTIGGY